jgi:HSP20 family protein
MIVRQLSPWTPAWTAPNAAYAQMRREMESLMDRLTGAAGDGQTAGVFPPVNVAEDGDHYYVRALVPGLDPAQLDVSVVNQTVTISGTRAAAAEEGASVHRKERPEGSFSRSVTLPALFEGGAVEAKYADGILTLTLPKPATAKPRRVTVQSA